MCLASAGYLPAETVLRNYLGKSHKDEDNMKKKYKTRNEALR